MKKILVTGATGFVGKAIVSELAKNGFDLYTCAKSPAADLPNYFSVDISADESVARLFEELPDLDVVVHSAGLAHQFKDPKDPGIFNRVNSEGTKKIAGLALQKNCKKFILISSISVYGNNKPDPTDEEFKCEPSGPYAVSKYAAEIAAREVCERDGGALTILRLATVYGPGDVGNVRRLIKLIDSGKFFWAGKGENHKSLLFNKDAAKACRIAAENDMSGVQVYNVTDAPHTMREIVETIAGELGKKIPSLSISPALIKTTLGIMNKLPVIGTRSRSLAESLKKWQSDDVLSGEKIERELNFKAETSLAEGIKKEVEWYLNDR